MRDLDPELYSEAQRLVFDLARQRLLATVARAVGDIGEWRQSLVGLADALEDIESDVGAELARSLPDITEDDVATVLSRGAES